MNWKLPNQLTVGRVVLAGLFFVLIGLYEQGAAHSQGLLVAAFGVYIVAGITDVLDGYFARKWNITSAFGRIVDPIVDKVLVVGAFAMLTASNYAMPQAIIANGSSFHFSSFELDLPLWFTGHMLSAVQGWMVVVIMSREFIVSAVRGYSESCGIKFPATSAGKIKMFVQSVAICVILVQLALFPDAPWAIVVKIVMVWLAVIATLLSGLAYVGKARKLLLAVE